MKNFKMKFGSEFVSASTRSADMLAIASPVFGVEILDIIFYYIKYKSFLSAKLIFHKLIWRFQSINDGFGINLE